MTLVDALWVGPSGYDLPPSTRVLENGDAVYRVPLFEARDSDNWKPLGEIAPVGTQVIPPKPKTPGGSD